MNVLALLPNGLKIIEIVLGMILVIFTTSTPQSTTIDTAIIQM
jgi:hypothetical protein